MKYQITIPKPCQEDWNKMTATEKGRFCNSCKKEVIDFTNLYASKISKKIFREENLCGRFKQAQINKEINIAKKSSFPKVVASFVLVSSMLTESPIFSQVKKDTTEVCNAKQVKGIAKKYFLTNCITIKGEVKDESGGLPGASILLKGTNKGTQTDFDGNFSIKIPNKKGNSPILVISYLGYKTREINITTLNKSLNIFLEEEKAEKVETVIVGMIAVKKTNIFKRIGNLFRKKENRKY